MRVEETREGSLNCVRRETSFLLFEDSTSPFPGLKQSKGWFTFNKGKFVRLSYQSRASF